MTGPTFRDLAAMFLRWTGMRAVLHRGYWLVASLYLVVDADLSAFQLVFLEQFAKKVVRVVESGA
jgi:hypothetical protein